MKQLSSLVFATFVLALLCPTALLGAAEKPNIIQCMMDDQGWGDTRYNGHPHLKTPHLDQMATEGVKFSRFYAAADPSFSGVKERLTEMLVAKRIQLGDGMSESPPPKTKKSR